MTLLLYVLRDEAGRYKIGSTEHTVSSRVQSMSTGNAVPHTCVASLEIPAVQVEHLVQNRLGPWLIRKGGHRGKGAGEWFSASTQVQAFVDMARYHPELVVEWSGYVAPLKPDVDGWTTVRMTPVEQMGWYGPNTGPGGDQALFIRLYAQTDGLSLRIHEEDVVRVRALLMRNNGQGGYQRRVFASLRRLALPDEPAQDDLGLL